MTRERWYYTIQVLAWSAVGFFQTAIAISVSRDSKAVFATYGIGCASAVLVTHLLRQLIRKRRWVELHPVPLLPRIAGISFAGGVFNTCIVAILVLPIVGVKEAFQSMRYWLGPAIGNWSSLIFIWMLAYFGIHYFERFLKLELDAKNAQMRSLEAQLNPHFLFNCLNGLRGLIGEDPAKAQQMLTELSELLRYSLRPLTISTVPLAEEMQAVEAFLKLEKMRFEERLQVSHTTSREAAEQRIPPMLMQTLVENAVKHGISNSAAGGLVEIQAMLRNGHLEITVRNPGQMGLSSGSTKVGLANARERLRLLYGSAACLRVENDGPSHVIARAELPI